MDAHNLLQQSRIETIPEQAARETHDVSLSEVFGLTFSPKVDSAGQPVLDAAGKPVHKDKQIQAFTAPGSLTPAINPSYKFPKMELLQFLQALEARETTYLLGHSGTGKTELVNQVAARLNYNVVCINFDGHLSRGDLVGDWKISNGQMVFRYGLVPLGFTEPGTIVLFDEIDACPPETAFVLQRAVSADRKFLMHETNQLIQLHSQNVIVGTANTNGMGDDTSLYLAGTNVQNFSFLNRWQTTIQIDYISPEAESSVLSEMFPEAHVRQYIPQIVKVLAAVRSAFKNNTMSVPLTTRDGINWCSKIRRVPMPMSAARYSFLDKLPPNDAMAIAQLIQRHMKCPDKDDKKYLGVTR